jgi:hypothetical protein
MNRYFPSAVVLLSVFLLCLAIPGVGRVHATEDRRTEQMLLNSVSTGSASAGNQFMTQCRESAVYIIWGAGTSAGAVTIESSYLDTYAGTWAPITTVAWSAASKQDMVQLTGVQMNLRTRVSTTIVGGTVSTWLVCN